MAKKKKRGKRKFTIPIAPVVGLLAGMSVPIKFALRGDYDAAIRELSTSYTGYDPQTKIWNPAYMMKGLVPLIIGGAVHKYVGGPPLNVNRMLAAANVPIIRI